MKYYYDNETDDLVCSESVLDKQEITFSQALMFRMKPLIDALDRHRNQKDYGIATTITDAEATAKAIELQALRDKIEGNTL